MKKKSQVQTPPDETSAVPVPQITVTCELGVFSADAFHHVTFIEVPPFKMAPEVVIWGTRVFIPCTEIKNPTLAPRYREAFAYASAS